MSKQGSVDDQIESLHESIDELSRKKRTLFMVIDALWHKLGRVEGKLFSLDEGGPVLPMEILNEQEAADLMGVSVRRLQSERQRSRGLPYVKYGSSVRYLLSDIQRYISDQKIAQE